MNRIKQLREEQKISQAELGKKLNKTQQQISLYENGTNELDLDGYIILSNIFNCSIEYIAGKTDIRNSQKLNINDADIAFFNGIKGLNETNREILKNIYEGLKAKQEQEKNEKK